MKTRFLLINLFKTILILLCILMTSCIAKTCKYSTNSDNNAKNKSDLKKRDFILNNCYNEFKATLAFESFENSISEGSFEKRRGNEHLEKKMFTNYNTEEYDHFYENNFRNTRQNPLSTFSIDVDTASYSNIRRFIRSHRLPPKDAVRTEEMINYFSYHYSGPKTEHPFSVITELSDCPWNLKSKLVHIGLKGKTLDKKETKASNLVFLIDASGSMNSENKMPLLKKAFRLLVNELNKNDRIAIVTYANDSNLVLPSTKVSKRNSILSAIHNINAKGSTAGNKGLQMAYAIAEKNMIHDGNNRVILATDGDFNVGASSTGALVRLIEEKRNNNNIYLTICGFGMGNYKDSKMEKISNAGNGNYYYIDNINEAEKVFVSGLNSTLYTIAKDVRIQIEFNPAKIEAYRLIGYENRKMNAEDFNDDTKDAGEIGPGHTVTALYEILPVNSPQKVLIHDQLKYQETIVKHDALTSNEIMTVKLRYKNPDQKKSKLIVEKVFDKFITLNQTSANFRFSAAVAGFGMILKDSKFKGDMTYEKVIQLAKNAEFQDDDGSKSEFIHLVKSCVLLSDNKY